MTLAVQIGDINTLLVETKIIPFILLGVSIDTTFELQI